MSKDTIDVLQVLCIPPSSIVKSVGIQHSMQYGRGFVSFRGEASCVGLLLEHFCFSFIVICVCFVYHTGLRNCMLYLLIPNRVTLLKYS